MDRIAPNETDPLNEIFKLLGNEPHLDALVDNVSHKSFSQTTSSINTNNSDTLTTSDAYNNTQICLTLTNRFTPIKEEKTDLNNLFIKYNLKFI